MEKEKDYFTKIDAWKARRDNEAYQAAVKAENEYWEAQEKIKQFWPRVNEACKVFEKCLENGIKFDTDFYANSAANKVGFFTKSVYNYIARGYDKVIRFGWHIPKSGLSFNHLLITEDGSAECLSCDSIKKANTKPCAYTINSHINDIEPFLTRFYKELDKILEN